MKTIIKKQGTLQGRDYLKGIGIGAATAAVWAVIEFVQSWLADGGDIFDINGKELLRAGIAGLIAYIGKNLFEPSKVVTVHAEGKEARDIIAAKDEGNPPPMIDTTHRKEPLQPRRG